MQHNGTAILALWVPAVVFAHVFAAFWFLRTWFIYDPRCLASLRRGRRSSAGGGAAPRSRADGDAASGSEGGSDAHEAELKLGSEVAFKQGPKGTGLDPRDLEACSGGSGGGSGSGLSRLPSEAFDDSARSNSSAGRVQPATLEWQQLCCAYRVSGSKVLVLQDVWGQALPSEMQALLGPSGAGKSTLMDILAQRKSTGQLSGVLLVNGRPATSSFIRKTAYVPQEDNFVATMTTEETMAFYADIILPKAWSKADRKGRVGEVLAAMGLRHRTRTMVGGSLPGGLLLRGLSGGERKRLSIAAGIIAAPSIVFLDEPTSGLDSFAALTVMGFLKRMARDNGHVVIASIHQPRSAIWSMFDKVTLLASGRLMFHGARDDLVPWFGHLGYGYDASLHGVASDWALDLVAIGFHKPRRFYGHTITGMDELVRASSEFVASYTRNVSPFAGGNESMIGSKSLSQKMQARVNKLVGVRSTSGGAQSGAPVSAAVDLFDEHRDLSVGSTMDAKSFGVTAAAAQQSKWATGWWRQFTSCYGRELLAITRNPADVAGRTMTFAWVAILMGLLYYGMPQDATSIRGRLNMTFNNLTFFCLMPYISMSLYCADKKFYIADASAKLYRSHAYYVAKTLAITPFHIISSLVFTFTVYGMTGLRPGARYVLENGVVSTLLLLISVQVMHCCAIFAPNQDAAFMLSIVWTAIQLLMSNFFIIFTDVAFQWLTALRWVSALYYAFEGLAVTEFGGVRYPCDQGMDANMLESLRSLLPNSRFMSMPFVVSSLQNPGADCIADADAVLKYYGFTRSFGSSLAILLGYWGVTHALTYAVMIFVARKERR